MSHSTSNVSCTEQAHESTDAKPRKQISIVHTRTEGTLLSGSSKGDGVWEIVRGCGFRFSRNVGIYIPHSRDRAAKSWNIDRAAAALREAGFGVSVEIDNSTAGRSFAEAEADRTAWAEDRTERFADRASRNAAESNTRWARSSDGLPEFGQPILVGHHSERRHRRALDRAHNHARAAIDLGKKAEYWAQRASAAGAYETHRKDPGRTLRRIDKLEADRRRIVRTLERGWERESSPDKPAPEGATLVTDWGNGYALWRVEPSAEYKAERQADLDQIDDELGYWRHIIEEAAKNGVKIWSKADFVKGDFVLYRYGAAVEVTRVNAKSVTIPWAHYWINSGPLVTVESCMKIVKGDGHMSGDRMHTDTVPYDDVVGRLSKEEVAELLGRGATVAEVKAVIRAKIQEARGQADPEQPATDVDK